MRVFLTGAAGFIGSRVAKILASEGCEVYALTRRNDSPEHLRRIEEFKDSIRFIHGDLADAELLRKEILRIKPEITIHLAWYAVPGEYLESAENEKLLASSEALARIAAAAGCRKMVSAGTCFEYDTTVARPLSESSAVKPSTLYARCKLALFNSLQKISKETGMEIGWTRFFYLYGPFEDERRLVAAAIRALLQGKPMKTTAGVQTRDFLHVDDVAGAVWAVAKSGASGAVNVGSGEPVTVTEIVTKIAEILGRADLLELGAIPPRPWDAPYICADNRKLREETPWKRKYTLDAGLRNTVEWWRNVGLTLQK